MHAGDYDGRKGMASPWGSRRRARRSRRRTARRPRTWLQATCRHPSRSNGKRGVPLRASGSDEAHSPSSVQPINTSAPAIRSEKNFVSDENIVNVPELFSIPDPRPHGVPDTPCTIVPYGTPSVCPDSDGSRLRKNGITTIWTRTGDVFHGPYDRYWFPRFSNLGYPRSVTWSSLPSAMADGHRVATVLLRGVHLVPLLRGLWFYP